MQQESEQFQQSGQIDGKMQRESDSDERLQYQLRQQILSYKNFQRYNYDRSGADMEKSILGLSKDQWEIERERIFYNSLKYYQDKVEKNEELKALLRDRMTKRTNEQQMEQAKSLIEVIHYQYTPKQTSNAPISFFSEKMQYFVDKRKSEIQTELTSKQQISQEQKMKLKLEYLFLNQRDFYIKTKDAIMGPLVQEEQQQAVQARLLERQLLDRNYYRRDKPTRRIESRLSDKFELNMIRHEQARRKRQKQKEFMHAIFAHQIEFFEFHRKKYKHARKRGTGARTLLEQMEKKKQDSLDKQDRERIKVLKAQNFDAYMDLVQQTKNTRILEILKQTDDFLRQIGAKVKVQKGDQQDDYDDDMIQQQENLALNLKNSSKVYYNLTHTVREDINEQPTLLEGGKLKSYQLKGLSWLISLYNNRLNGILADEMGLGKTIQTISLVCYLMESKKNYGPFLIIVPLSTLSNWSLEFDKWAPSINKLIYKGSPQARKDIAKLMKTTKWNICLTTYEYVLKDRLALSKFEWKYIIVDEGHRMKNYRSKFAQVLGQQYQSERRLLLTGTPLQNNMAELWALLNFLLPRVFSSCEDFEKWFAMPLSRMGGNEKEVGLNEEEQLLIINRLHQVLQPFLLRRVKKEVESQLPRKLEYVIKIELSAWQKKIYQQIQQRGVMTFDQQSGKTGSQALQNLMMQLRKICNHPYLFMLNLDMSKVSDEIWRSSGKFELLDRMIPKILMEKHRILIFSQMTQLMDILEVFFEYRGLKFLRLDGSTKSEDREHRIGLFNKEGSIYSIFLLSTRAGGLGLNLQTADTVILFDSDWNPQMDLQAQDRAYRIGQKNEVRVYRLVTATMIEEEILNKAEYKMGLDQVIIQAGLFNQKSTDQERRERLQDFFKSKTKYDAFESEEIPNDEQINEWLARTEEEFELFCEMDKERYEREKKIYKKFREPSKDDQKSYNYRLIQDDEVPEWVNQKHTDVLEEKEYGRGNRARKQVNYTDDLSDNQFMRMVEEGVDPNYLIERLRGSIEIQGD